MESHFDLDTALDNLREKMRIGTWNVRNMNQGKLDIVKREMDRIDVNLLGVSEMKWTGIGHFKSDNHKMLRYGTVWLSYVQMKYEDVLWDSTL